MEIHLRETADLVDHYFLVEATITHKGENKPILWERLRCTHVCLDCQNTISLHHRFTERFSFLKEDQVIHVVVDHLGDYQDHRSKAAGNGINWWVFKSQVSRLQKVGRGTCFYFAGGLSSSKQRLG